MPDTTEDAGASYQKGLSYLTAARRILVACRALDDDDREHVRRLADGYVAKGTSLLTEVVRPKRARRQPVLPGLGGGSSSE